jgi:hypothetical protein
MGYVDDAGGRLEQLNLNSQAQSVCSRCGVSGVIDSRLEHVRWTTTFMLFAVGYVGGGAQLALVALSSVVWGVGFGSCC